MEEEFDFDKELDKELDKYVLRKIKEALE